MLNWGWTCWMIWNVLCVLLILYISYIFQSPTIFCLNSRHKMLTFSSKFIFNKNISNSRKYFRVSADKWFIVWSKNNTENCEMNIDWGKTCYDLWNCLMLIIYMGFKNDDEILIWQTHLYFVPALKLSFHS